MLIFFLIVLSVLFFSSWYVYSRGMMALEGTAYTRLFSWLFWMLVVTFVAGQVMERGEPTLAGKIVTWTGSLWLSVFLYLFLFVVLADAVRLLHHFFPFFPAQLIKGVANGRLLFVTAVVIASGMTLYGVINARHPVIKKITVHTAKPAGLKNPLKIVMVSDVHIGAVISNSRVEKMIDEINGLQPDIVIFAGDLVDHNPRFLIAGDIGKHFLRLKSTYGVYAVAGNHEFIGHAEISIDYLSRFGVRYIRDTIAEPVAGIIIAGRDDRDKIRFTGTGRKSLSDILPARTGKQFVILADHQPVDYPLAQRYGVDLMLSGHTHKGQLWPFGFITSAVYHNDYGLIKKGHTTYYTSSGYGTWGPPVRTGNRPEIVEITVVFDGREEE